MQDIFTTDGIALFPKSPPKGGDASHDDWGQAFITLGKALSSSTRAAGLSRSW
jgi:hypothetical protein